ncbi:MAG TPA: hypothetical protein DEQ43_09965 [Nocardioides bacterium]|uniref:hypothetical protein n=1 Tax=uncultured Nocardioides sp. TaxID=198441 RepID=UPI000EE326D7|nr:hypothetical protein [uncultured Nocardioides sp.]HCB04554.1 hypothetical protein [Nocardioides sp.]HRD62335.1 hypothetical protein [Nocardioides sp.]
MSEVDAQLARSILACPASAEVAVEGFPAVGCDSDLGLRDEDGTPTFSCRTTSEMAEAGRTGSQALVTLASGLGPADSPERGLTLTLTGTLAIGTLDSCTCCGEVRHDVALHLDFVVLGSADGDQRRVPLAAFLATDLKLNRGYLQRALEHANDCHRDDLGQVVARTTGTPPEHLLDVVLTDLTTHGAELSWIDRQGGHRAALWFSRPARTVEELGVLLRKELHAGIC